MSASLEAETAATRDSLICAHLPQVRLIAQRVYAQLNGRVELDDLISAGTIGLITAVDRFDPTLGAKLKTYAEHKIRGAILDSVAKFDGRHKEERRMARTIETATLTVEQRAGRAATREEVAAELGISLDELHTRLQRSATISLLSFHNFVSHNNPRVASFEGDLELPTQPDDSPEAEAARAEIREMVDVVINTLDNKEQDVLRLFFGHGLQLTEIAEMLDEPEWRVLKIKKRALERTRQRLGCAYHIVTAERRAPVPVQGSLFSALMAPMTTATAVVYSVLSGIAVGVTTTV